MKDVGAIDSADFTQNYDHPLFAADIVKEDNVEKRFGE